MMYLSPKRGLGKPNLKCLYPQRPIIGKPVGGADCTARVPPSQPPRLVLLAHCGSGDHDQPLSCHVGVGVDGVVLVDLSNNTNIVKCAQPTNEDLTTNRSNKAIKTTFRNVEMVWM